VTGALWRLPGGTLKSRDSLNLRRQIIELDDLVLVDGDPSHRIGDLRNTREVMQSRRRRGSRSAWPSTGTDGAYPAESEPRIARCARAWSVTASEGRVIQSCSGSAREAVP
jgi:hypothetical protein